MKVLDLVLKILNLANNFKDNPTTAKSGWKSEKTVLDKIVENDSGRKEKTHRS